MGKHRGEGRETAAVIPALTHDVPVTFFDPGVESERRLTTGAQRRQEYRPIRPGPTFGS